jgi:GxxExxY protein
VECGCRKGIFEHESTKARKHEQQHSSGTCVHRFEDLSGQVIGAALAVHKELGPGFLESTYHAAMRVSLAHRAIPFDSQLPVRTSFEGVVVSRARIDLVVANQIVVELKAVENLRDVHFVQLKSYLRATNPRVGLLFNFNSSTLTTRRMVLD